MVKSFNIQGLSQTKEVDSVDFTIGKKVTRTKVSRNVGYTHTTNHLPPPIQNQPPPVPHKDFILHLDPQSFVLMFPGE